LFYKGFNKNLQGYNNYQFSVGETYSTDNNDTWLWFHYTKYVSSTIIYFDKDIRICEVEPVGKTSFFKDSTDGYKKGYYTTNKLKITRELSKSEIFDSLYKEKCRYYLVQKLNPPINILIRYKSKIRGSSYCSKIIQRADLRSEEKKLVIPKCWHKYI